MLQVERESGLLRLAIANPPLNVLTQAVRDQLGSLLLALQDDAHARCVIFASGERAFCAGADLKEFSQRFDPQVARAHGANAHRMILALVELDTPVVASLRGYCMGGGLELALGCSWRIAARSCQFALPEINRGVWPGTGGSMLLTRLVGPSVAKRVLYTGTTLSAEEALRLGLIDQVVDDARLETSVQEFAVEIAAKPRSSIRTLSQLVDRDFRQAFREHLRFELEQFVQAYQLPDAREGVDAFFGKREPRWAQR